MPFWFLWQKNLHFFTKAVFHNHGGMVIGNRVDLWRMSAHSSTIRHERLEKIVHKPTTSKCVFSNSELQIFQTDCHEYHNLAKQIRDKLEYTSVVRRKDFLLRWKYVNKQFTFVCSIRWRLPVGWGVKLSSQFPPCLSWRSSPVAEYKCQTTTEVQCRVAPEHIAYRAPSDARLLRWASPAREAWPDEEARSGHRAQLVQMDWSVP